MTDITETEYMPRKQHLDEPAPAEAEPETAETVDLDALVERRERAESLLGEPVQPPQPEQPGTVPVSHRHLWAAIDAIAGVVATLAVEGNVSAAAQGASASIHEARKWAKS